MACIAVLAGAGWLYLGLMLARAPGDIFAAICGAVPGSAQGVSGYAAAFGMWSAMVLAMMLPSAGPMILTYAEIADTAARKGKPVVSPLVIASGFMTVWLLFAATASALQLVLARVVLFDSGAQKVTALFAAAIFVVAGLYQFSALEHACLRLCRNPFSFFFTNWATTPGGVFRLGYRQGLYCLGCCWAMMLVMFAVGLMNVLWMATLGITMTIEKMVGGRLFPAAVGVVLLAIGGSILVMAN
jgi:predicted metal-binding membrane protein